MSSVSRTKKTANDKTSNKLTEIALKKEKILQLKRSILSIVESLLEQVPTELFLKNCVKLCQADYDDVVQERSIVNLCGYPLCSNPIKKVIKQQYHISRVTNKVYDLTERKCFCSNECYKASNYVKAQLSPIPLYMRKEEAISIRLLSKPDNKGSIGEEVEFHQRITANDVEKIDQEEPTEAVLKNILHEQVKNCIEHISSLTITEKSFENAAILKKNSTDQTHSYSEDKDSSESSSSNDTEDDDDKNLFPDYDNVTALNDKLMPVPKTTKKALYITPSKSTSLEGKVASENPSIEFFQSVFWDWFTEDTLKFLLGERIVYSLKADVMFTSQSTYNEDLPNIKDKYVDMCVKVNKLPDSDSDELDLDVIAEDLNACIPKTKSGKNENARLQNSVKLKSRKGSQKHGNTKNCDNPKSSPLPKVINKAYIPPSIAKEPNNSESLPDPVFPLIDTISHNAIRRNILISKLKPVYMANLPVISLHYHDIRNEITNISETFSLTPTNILFKPKEWKYISVMLFRILTKTVLQNLHNDDCFNKLCENVGIPLSIYTCEIEHFINDLIGIKQLQRIQIPKI